MKGYFAIGISVAALVLIGYFIVKDIFPEKGKKSKKDMDIDPPY